MTLIIYYMASLAGSLREANNDLKVTTYKYAAYRALSNCIMFYILYLIITIVNILIIIIIIINFIII